MKSQLNKQQIQELKESNQNLSQAKKENFKSRHKMEHHHLYLNQNLSEQIPVIKSRRKKP